jgi:hypothetical protein
MEGIEDLLIKARLDLSPQLRELDARIESVELGLRELISKCLVDDPDRLPSHVQLKIEDRLQKAAKKNPAFDSSSENNLTKQLEFADLRELQDIILGKIQWPEFENRFGSKGTLSNRFSQLAELRNSIRHSRSVSEVARKDGEASLLWFEAILNE